MTMVRSRGHELPFLADVVQSTKMYATAWEIVMRGNAHAVVHLRMIHQFLKLVHLRIRVRK